MNNPTISVLLPAYNAEKYIRKSIDSILAQTFQDFELVIINDGSSDKTAEIIQSYTDPRIKYIEREHRGLVETLNEGIDLSRGQYIARMDADDIALKNRLAKQLQFMESHPDYAVCFTRLKIFYYQQLFSVGLDHPETYDEIRTEMFIHNPFPHATALIRTEILRRDKFYFDPSFVEAAEDYEFFARIAYRYKIYCLPEYLYYYRKYSGQTTAKTIYKSHLHLENEARQKIISAYFNLSKEEALALVNLNNASIGKTDRDKQILLTCFQKMEQQNIEKKIFDTKSMQRFFCVAWRIFCSKNKDFPLLSKLRCFFSQKNYASVHGFFKLSTILVFLKN